MRFNKDTSHADIFGKLVPVLDASSEEKFCNKVGPVTKGIKNGNIILIENLN